jgi:hypothetical protein
MHYDHWGCSPTAIFLDLEGMDRDVLESYFLSGGHRPKWVVIEIYDGVSWLEPFGYVEVAKAGMSVMYCR